MSPYKKYIIHVFPRKDYFVAIADKEAFLHNDPKLRNQFNEHYTKNTDLYCKSQPDFDEILAKIGEWVKKL